MTTDTHRTEEIIEADDLDRRIYERMLSSCLFSLNAGIGITITRDQVERAIANSEAHAYDVLATLEHFGDILYSDGLDQA